MSRRVTHLFFDLGNVLVGLRSGEKLKALAERTGQNVEAFCEKIWSHKRAHDYERGVVSCDEYFRFLAADLHLAQARQKLQEAFCDIFYPLPERVALVRQLALHYPLAIISNTCASHIQYLETHYDFFPLFQHRVYSHQAGCRKPHPDIYKKALMEVGAHPETSLFIDDLAENLETPRKSGWQTLHLPPGTDLEKELLTFQISGIKKA
jgi:HAD superfamily hydrolase (TIGR01509 family)